MCIEPKSTSKRCCAAPEVGAGAAHSGTLYIFSISLYSCVVNGGTERNRTEQNRTLSPHTLSALSLRAFILLAPVGVGIEPLYNICGKSVVAVGPAATLDKHHTV